MEWWQVLLVLVSWIACSLLFGVVWALGHREKRPAQPHCPGCGAYGQKAAPVQAPKK